MSSDTSNVLVGLGKADDIDQIDLLGLAKLNILPRRLAECGWLHGCMGRSDATLPAVQNDGIWRGQC